MRVTIYQPRYFPQLHYFNRVLNSDVFVILESAQYTKALSHITKNGRERHKSYQSDTPIKISSGEYLLTIPVKHDGLLPINKTKIDYSHKWILKHLTIIKSAYGKTELFDKIFPKLREILLKQYNSLADLNIATIVFGLSYILGLEIFDPSDFTLEKVNQKLANFKYIRLKKILSDKEISVIRPEGLRKGTEWTTAICQALNANEYYHGGTAKDSYMELDYYKKRGITPVMQDWQLKTYRQQFSDKVGFIANLCILDLLFNVDQKEALKIIL